MKSLGIALVVLIGVSLSAQSRFVPGKYLSRRAAQIVEVSTEGNFLKWTIGAHVFYWGGNGDIPLEAHDYDGDGLDDPTIYHPQTHEWWILRSRCEGGRWTCYDVLTMAAVHTSASEPLVCAPGTVLALGEGDPYCAPPIQTFTCPPGTHIALGDVLSCEAL
jgi:hypothetical protein